MLNFLFITITNVPACSFLTCYIVVCGDRKNRKFLDVYMAQSWMCCTMKGKMKNGFIGEAKFINVVVIRY